MRQVLTALKECGRSRDIETGKLLHAHAVSSGLVYNTYIANTLISMYAKCRCPEEARKVFDSMPRRVLVSWNCMIQGYVENGENELAMSLFSNMEPDPDPRTFVAAIGACSNLASSDVTRWLQVGRELHSRAVASRCCNTVVENSLIKMYAKCGCLYEARRVFEKMTERNTSSWNALLQGYVENGEANIALETFDAIDVPPDTRTYTLVLTALSALCENACAGISEKGRLIHSRAVAERCLNVVVETALVDMYAKCGDLARAREVFEKMNVHDTVAWTCLIHGYMQNGEPLIALELFEKMNERKDARTYVAAVAACSSLADRISGRSTERRGVLEKGELIHSLAVTSGCCNVFLENALVTMYAKCGDMHRARDVFDGIEEKSLVSWNGLLWGYVENGDGQSALELSVHMRNKHISYGPATFVAALTACGLTIAAENGREFHADALRLGCEHDTAVCASLVELYGRSGSMEVAEHLFGCSYRDIRMWNALMCGYGHQGFVHEVFEAFRELQQGGCFPSAVTFTHYLAACSHGGVVDKGKGCFSEMCSKHGIQPDVVHYTCMVDLLARANRFDEAEEMARRMSSGANVVTWTALLSAAWKWKNVEMGKLAYDSLMRMGVKDAAPYNIMANIYGSVSMHEEKRKVMDSKAMFKLTLDDPSWWIDQTGKPHKFLATEDCYTLCSHTGKLAIAFGIRSTVDGMTIRITKKLRVCRECHLEMGFISKIEKRRIVCKDESVVHVFVGGKCSCNDHGQFDNLSLTHMHT